MDDPVAVALALAGRQLAFLRCGDFESYEDAQGDYLQACHAVASLAARGPGIGRLAAAVEEISSELGRLRGETGAAMNRLRAGSTVAGAYLAPNATPRTAPRTA